MRADSHRVVFWGVAAALLVYVVGYIGGGYALDRFAPSLWVGVGLLFCGAAALGLMIVGGARKSGLQLWAWGVFPFLIAFTCLMLAQRELARILDVWWVLLIVLASLAPVLALAACVIRARLLAPGASVELPGGEAPDHLGEHVEPGD